MKLIQQSAEIWEQPEGREGIYKQIEKAARLCYKSEDRITDDSYKRFMTMLEDKKHRSPYEHGSIYLKVPMHIVTNALAESTFDTLNHNPYTRIDVDCDNYYYSTNMRVIIENHLEEVLQYLCEPTKYHEKRISVHIITSIGISRELNRHRCHSICEESTRYCNYSKDKFGNELTFIVPNWVNTQCPNGEHKGPSVADIAWSDNMRDAEANYFLLLQDGWKPQQARSVLPLDTKTELIHTAFESDWEQFFKLRCSSAAHPMMQDLANKIKEVIYARKSQ